MILAGGTRAEFLDNAVFDRLGEYHCDQGAALPASIARSVRKAVEKGYEDPTYGLTEECGEEIQGK